LHTEDWVVIAGLGVIRPGDSVEPRKKPPAAHSDTGRDGGR
jgi:hypothetical protein